MGRGDEHAIVDIPLAEGALELEAAAILPDRTQHGYVAGAQRRQVVRDGPARGGRDAGLDNAETRNSGFARGVRFRGVVVAPTVQADVADDERPAGSELLEQGGGFHESCSPIIARRKAGNATR